MGINVKSMTKGKFLMNWRLSVGDSIEIADIIKSAYDFKET